LVRKKKRRTVKPYTLSPVLAAGWGRSAEGGDSSLENLVTACLDCNAKRNKSVSGNALARIY
jgi:5-methylcytosine-specific restriction endonuclease McrA